jgi:acetyl-CoA/propionyl-CoA carboxylase carboxyl transferase subunit
MGAVAAVRIIHRRKLAEVSDDIRPQMEQELAAEHEQVSGGLQRAIEIGVVDEVVEPGASRSAIAAAIAAAPGGVGGDALVRGRHGNIPL